jgi:hypothetical protein
MIEREAIPKMMVLLTWRGQITSKKKKKNDGSIIRIVEAG